jgi:hypothetical protein
MCSIFYYRWMIHHVHDDVPNDAKLKRTKSSKSKPGVSEKRRTTTMKEEYKTKYRRTRATHRIHVAFTITFFEISGENWPTASICERKFLQIASGCKTNFDVLLRTQILQRNVLCDLFDAKQLIFALKVLPLGTSIDHIGDLMTKLEPIWSTNLV